MQELMSRHKAYALSPRDCLKTTLFQKWQKMVAPPGKSLKTTSMPPKSVVKHGRDFSETLFFCHPDLTQFFFVETTRPTKNRRKRKGAAAAATGAGGGGPGGGGGGGISNKKRSPGHNFPLASQVKKSCTLFGNSSKCLIWIFELWRFPPIFVLLKLTCLATLFVRKLQVFKHSPKLTIFGIFSELLSTQNVNVAEWDFFCDFQTP